MKNIVLLIAFLFVPFFLFSQSVENEKKILMVLSSYGKDLGKSRPGYEFDEFSQAYLIFKQNNLLIDVASPKGGKVESDQFNVDKAYNKAVLEDQFAMNLLNETIPTANVNEADYDAIYIVGGKGAMFDLPYDPSLQDVILNLYKRDGTVISSVCHGPASFANIKDGDDYIVKDAEITGFCNLEEDLFGKKWVKEFPFRLEDKLKTRGASFTQADFMLSHVAVSGKFITGQNPFSTTRSSEEVVKALGIKLKKRTLYKDEKSVYLIQDVLDGRRTAKEAEKELKENLESFDIPIIAIWGYYKILSAKDNVDELSKGVSIVEVSSPYFFDENLQLVLAQAHITLGDKNKAKHVLDNLISRDLLKEKASELLTSIEK